MSKILVDTIDTRSGTSNITIGSSNASQITLKSGATLTNFPKNSPTFLAYSASNQSCSNQTNTLVNIDTELFDIGGNFDTSAKRFTVTEAGYYYIFYQYRWETATDFDDQKVWISYNSSTYPSDNIISTWGANDYYTKQGSYQTRLLAVGDTLDLYAYQNSGGSKNLAGGDDFGLNTTFGAYKLIT